MSNRRVKSLAYDDDDGFDDYEEDFEEGDNGLTSDDREQLRLGTMKVRESLGPSVPATDAEIEEALWHYYYDVEKSVTFIKSKYTPSTPKTKKKAVPAPAANLSSCSLSFSVKDFFLDCPWLNVPAHRQAEIITERLCPRPGLLGGSSNPAKMSKLAVLAAKRRQKENSKPAEHIPKPNAPQDDISAGLNGLHVSAGKSLSSRENLEPISKSEPSDGLPASPSQDSRPHVGPPLEPPLDTPDDVLDSPIQIRANPSPFAQMLLGRLGSKTENSFEFIAARSTLDAKSFDFTEPSPDDIVTKAQSSKATNTTKPKLKDNAKPKADLSKDITHLSIQEPVRLKSKNLDVAAEYKKIKRKNAANFVVIGHVDAGKSTLMGRLLFDLKAVDARTIEKYKKEAEKIGKGSFAFAWVLDQGTEERARGVTIDIATNKFETEKTSFTILDAPGHRDFVPNMIAGASQADFAVLVIDASTGNFESGLKGQTKEHALLVRSIGVQRIIVAVNKMDLASWSQERFEEIQQQMSGFLSSAGFQAKNIAFVPCSGLEGENILLKTEDPKASWYTGPTLVQELDMSEPTSYALDKPLRMTVGDVFRGGVQNPLSVSGRIEAGNIQVGEQISIMPSAEKAFVKTLEVDDEPQDWAVAGQNVVLNLTDIDAAHLKIGDVLCSPASPIQNITSFTAKILAFNHLTPMTVDIHRGRLHIPGRISQLVATLDKSSGAVLKKKPKIVQPGSLVRVVVDMQQAVPLEAPARIVLRAGGETVAAGLIE